MAYGYPYGYPPTFRGTIKRSGQGWRGGRVAAERDACQRAPLRVWFLRARVPAGVNAWRGELDAGGIQADVKSCAETRAAYCARWMRA